MMLHGGNLFHDEIMRVPLIIKLPRQNNNPRETNELVESLDIMPFIWDFLEIENKPHMQGISFLPLINNKSERKRHVYGCGADRAKAFIRDEQWKLVSDHYLRKEGYRLFKLNEDPLEFLGVKDKYLKISEYSKEKLLSRLNETLIKSEKEDVFITKEQQEKIKSLGYIK